MDPERSVFMPGLRCPHLIQCILCKGLIDVGLEEAAQWKFCPYCGKPADSDQKTEEAKIIVGDLISTHGNQEAIREKLKGARGK